MQQSALNKQGKFGVKIIWCYTDMAIFVLRCFILTHPVDPPLTAVMNKGLKVSVYQGAWDGAGRS